MQHRELHPPLEATHRYVETIPTKATAADAHIWHDRQYPVTADFIPKVGYREYYFLVTFPTGMKKMYFANDFVSAAAYSAALDLFVSAEYVQYGAAFLEVIKTWPTLTRPFSV